MMQSSYYVVIIYAYNYGLEGGGAMPPPFQFVHLYVENDICFAELVTNLYICMSKMVSASELVVKHNSSGASTFRQITSMAASPYIELMRDHA